MMASKFSVLVTRTAMPRALKRATLIVAMLATQACTVFPDSPAAKLYALDLPAANSIGTCAIRFAVREVRLPGYLDRPELVLSRDGSRTEVNAQHLWAAPLAGEVTRIVRLGLTERLNESASYPYPVRQAEKPDWIFAAELTRYAVSDSELRVEFQLRALKFPSSGADPIKGPWTASKSVPLQVETEAKRATAISKGLAYTIDLSLTEIAPLLTRSVCP